MRGVRNVRKRLVENGKERKIDRKGVNKEGSEESEEKVRGEGKER
jgi:hypothetical protein